MNCKTQNNYLSVLSKNVWRHLLVNVSLFLTFFSVCANNPTDSLLQQLQQIDSLSMPIEWVNKAEIVGINYQKNSDYVNALLYYHSALRVAQRTDLVSQSHKIVIRIAEVLYRQSKYDISLKYVKEIENKIDPTDLPLKAQVFRFISINKVYTGDYSDAYKYQNQALNLFQTLQDSVNLCRIHFGIGANFYFQKQYETALFHYNESLKIAQATENLHAIYGAYTAIGNLYEKQNNLSKSLEYNYSGLDIIQKLNDKSGIGWTLLNIGSTQGKIKGMEQQSIETLKKVETISQELGDIGLNAKAKMTLADVFLKIKNPNIALIYLNKSFSLAETENMRSFIVDIYEKIADCYYQKQDLLNYHKYSKKYIALKDSLFNDNLTKEMAGLKQNFAITQLEKENEVNLLKKDNEIQRVKTTFNIGLLIAIFIIAVLLLLLMYFRNKNQKEKNQLLETKNKEITRQNEILASSNRDLEQYAYIISHDLKEPLRNISSFTNLLNRKLKNSITPDTQQYMDYILKGTQQMHDLLHDLLLYSKISRHKKDIKTIDTHDLLTQIFAQLNLEINENQAQVRLKVLPSVSFDKQQLKIIFTHLIKNALKFRREENPIIEINYIENSDNHIFTVKDNGIGIEEKYYDRIFVIFQRIHDRGKYSGTSMGLATCKKILEEYNGNIWVTSIVNSGSTFYIQIPKK